MLSIDPFQLENACCPMVKGSLRMAFLTQVDEKKCLGCEECVGICSADVFEMRSGRSFAVRAEKCAGCQSCVQTCPEEAITVEDLRVRLSDQCLFLLRDILD